MTTETSGPMVSVVIPVYNAQDVIHATIESALKQTWHCYEIIVVDDGSSDRSGDIIKEFGDSVRYFYQQNGGVARARNRGIAEAKGAYIALLDHDDLWHETKVEKQVHVLEHDPNVGLVITDVAHLDQGGRPMGIIGPGHNPTETFAKLFVRGYVPTPSAAMVRTAVFKHLGGFDERFNSAGLDDHELWTRIAAQYDIKNIPEPLTFHRNRERKAAGIALGHRPLLIATLLERYGHAAEKRRYLHAEHALYLSDQGKHLVNQGQCRQGRRYLWQALKLSVGPALHMKTAWRCMTRIARSYL